MSGATFEIIVDGRTVSYRDRKEIAIEAAKYLKSRQPTSEIEVRDAGDNSVVAIDWANGVVTIRT